MLGKLQLPAGLGPRTAVAPLLRRVDVRAVPTKVQEKAPTSSEAADPHRNTEQGAGLGDLLGPFGLSYSSQATKSKADTKGKAEVLNRDGVALGPISLSFGSELGEEPSAWSQQQRNDDSDASSSQPAPSIHSMTTEEWRRLYEKDGTVDLWVEEEFNSGSRLVGGRAVHRGGTYGILTGEGPSVSNAVRHKVRIHNHYADQVVDVEVPEDRYILWEAEDEGLELPYACRMGCCTACAVRIKEGEMYQPEALGISQELRDQGYGLMCVGFPLSDLVLETVPEDEVYEMQFGAAFATQALDPANPGSIERDDYALSIANMDE